MPQSTARPPIAAARRVRHVALIVDTAVAPRRGMLRGVAQYIQEHEPWAVYLKPVGVEKALREWLLHWQGDGIIAAVHEPEEALLKERGLPVVDVAGAIEMPGVPLVHANDTSIGRVGAEHLLERGFRHFGFLEQPDKYWSVKRRDGFCAMIKSKGYTVVLVEQNFRFAAPLADRFYVMEHGQIVQQFAQGELKDNTAMLQEYLGV